MSTAHTAAALLAGAGLGWASAEAARRAGRRTTLLGGAGLVGAAAIYPAARRGFKPSAGLAVEAAVLAATSALTAVAVRADSTTGRRLVAAGWASHALFDFLQGPSDDSRLPGWYPPVCAGFDFAYAARLGL